MNAALLWPSPQRLDRVRAVRGRSFAPPRRVTGEDRCSTWNCRPIPSRRRGRTAVPTGRDMSLHIGIDGGHGRRSTWNIDTGRDHDVETRAGGGARSVLTVTAAPENHVLTTDPSCSTWNRKVCLRRGIVGTVTAAARHPGCAQGSTWNLARWSPCVIVDRCISSGMPHRAPPPFPRHGRAQRTRVSLTRRRRMVLASAPRSSLHAEGLLVVSRRATDPIKGCQCGGRSRVRGTRKPISRP